IIGLTALLSLSSFAAADEALPWDGRVQDLEVNTLANKYLADVLFGHANPTSYVNVTQTGRSPAYNGDTGIITLGVDAKAVYKGETSTRRSDLMQTVAANSEGTTFFRTSVMKDKAFLNPYVWQLVFPGSYLFEIRVDAAANPPMISYVNDGKTDAKWKSEFVSGTWYNFGVGVTKSQSGSGTVLAFYTSQGDKDLVLEGTHEIAPALPASFEYHIGLLTQSADGSDPVMNAEMETMLFNGVSIETSVVTAAAGAANTPA
ncbi:hypothetical protein PHYSODRAFT_439445, partial [Phytophthora sojae]